MMGKRKKRAFCIRWGILFFLITAGGGGSLWGQSPAPTKTWVAGSSGTWGTAAYWSGGTLPTTSDVVAIDGTSSVTLDADYTVNSVVFNQNNANTVTLYLNNHTLNVSGGSLNFGRSGGGTIPSNVNIVGPGSIVVTGYLDANEQAINTINLYNGVTISVSGTFWGNQNAGTSTTFNGDGTCSLSVGSMSGSGYNIIFNNMTIITGGVTYYSPTTSAPPAAGTTITVTVTGSFSSGTQFQYTTTYQNTNATTTEQYYVAGVLITSSVGATDFPTTSGAGTFSFTIQYPTTVDPGDGLNVSLLAPSGVVLGTISFTQPSATTWTWDGDTSTDWSDGNNWDVGTVPTSTSVVVIPAGTTYSPVLTGHSVAASVTVNSGATLDLNGYNLTGLSSFANNGTVRLRGTETVGGTKVNGSGSTIEYYGPAAMPVWGSSYQNLAVSASAALSLATVTATVAGNCTIGSGASLTLGAYNLTVTGTVSNEGTIILSGAGRPNKNDTAKGTVRYTAAGGTITDFGDTDYYNLELDGAGVFTATTPMVIANALIVTNSDGLIFQSTLSAPTVTLTNTAVGQTIDFQGAVNIGNLTTAAQGYNIAFNTGTGAQSSTITNPVTFTNTGTVTLGSDAADSITFTGGVTATAPSQVNLAGTIATGGGVGQNINLGDTDTSVVLVANTTLDAGTGNIALGGTLSGAYTLGISAPGGTVTMVSTNGTPTGLTSTSATFTTTGSVTVASGSAISITTDQINLGGTLGNGGAGAITLQPASDTTTIGLHDTAGAFNLTAAELGYLTTTGTVTIGRATGTGAITIGGSGNTNLSGTTYNLTIEGTSSPISFAASTLTLAAGRTLSFSNGGNITVTTGATHISIGGAAGTVAFSQVGSVGASGAALATNVGVIRATATGNIYISEANAVQLGDGTGGVTTSGGLIDIVAGGAITFGNTVTTTGTGTSISLNATAGGIAISQNIAAANNGAITLNAGGATSDITIAANIQSVTSGTLTLTAGRHIIRTAGTVGAAGSTSLLVLSASGSIGALGAAIATDVGTIRASAGGDIYISEASGVQLGDASGPVTTSNGVINITAAGNITTGIWGSGDIISTTGGTGSITLTTTAGGTMSLSDTVASVEGGLVTLTNAGLLTISALITARGGLTQNGAGAVSLGANITTTADTVSFQSAVTLAANVTIDTTNGGGSPAGGNINFQNTLSGTYNVTLDSGTSGTITVSGNVGTTPLVDLTITNCNGASFNGNVSAATLAINGVSIGQTVTVAGALNLTAGLTTAGGNYNIALNAGVGGQTSVVAGTTTFNNNTGTLTLGNDAADSITFTGGVTATAPSQVSLAGTIATGGVAGQNISLGDTDTPVMLAANTTLNTGTPGTVIIDTNVTIPANTTLDLGSSNFTITGITFADDTSVFRLTGTQATHTITTLDTSQGIVEYYGAAGTIFATGFGSAPGNNYPSLRIAAGSDTKTLAGDIVVHGNWTNEVGFTGFNSQSGTVIFTGNASDPIEIRGSNAWFVFECTTPGRKIQFENTASPTIQRIKTGGVFRVKGAAGNPITLTRLTGNTDPGNPPANPGDDQHFWFFELIPGATLDMEYVEVKYSNARQYPVSVPPNVNATPYTTYYCYKWLDKWFAIYSYTEDSDYNGKIDRLRIECEGFVGDDFSGFQVEVKNRDTGEAYQVTGYSRPEIGPNFYIYLQEKPYLDGGAVLLWRIVQNTSLKDGSMGDKLVGTLGSSHPLLNDPSAVDAGDWMITIDTVWPVVGYTLALPGQNQVFIHFSEPVVRSGGGAPDAGDFSLTGSITVVSGSGSGIREALGTVATTPTAATIAAGATNLSLTVDLQDMGGDSAIFPNWTVLYGSASDFGGQVIGAPDPSYPPATGYTASPSTYDRSPTRPAFGLQGGAGKISHRISDVLISVPPADAADDRYFVWPIWARDSVTTEVPESQYESAFPTGSDAAGQTIGLVRDFTGTQWLRDQDITMQVRVNPALSLANLSLHFDASVASSFRATAANGPVGLWLPAFNNGGPSGAAFSGIVPWPNDSSHGGGTSLYAGGKQGTSPLWNFTIPSSDPRVRSVSTLDFFFTLDDGSNTNDPLYVARLDIAPGAAIPDDWYRRVRPFSFDIHDVTKQRSNATILNNVIDPTKGERVRLSYQLTKAGQVTIQVFTLDGDLVQVLYRGYREAGDYTASWDGKNRGGRVVARGMYFIRIVGPDIDEIRKVMVVKE